MDLSAILKELRRLRPSEVHLTRRAGDAEIFARKAILAGCNYLIAAGGDGTLNEVVNGIARARGARKICVGLLPLGTGNDFARSLGLPETRENNIDILRAGVACVWRNASGEARSIERTISARSCSSSEAFGPGAGAVLRAP